MRESCEVCGFVWDDVTVGEIPPRLLGVAAGFNDVLGSTPVAVLVHRTEPEVWSALEYSCHVRDVLLNLRDRIIVGLAEDVPEPKSMFTGVRIAKGMYVDENPLAVASGVALAVDLLSKSLSALDEDDLARRIVYPWPRRTERTLLWVLSQALHEAEHHLADTRAQLSA